MTFWVGYTDFQILWNWWNVTSKGIFALSFLIVVVAGIARRLLSRHAEQRMKAPLSSAQAPLMGDKGNSSATGVAANAKLFRSIELTCYHALTFTLGYLLMLVAMTYNVGMFLAVVIGESIGFFLVDSLNRAKPGRRGYGAADHHGDAEMPIDDCCA